MSEKITALIAEAREEADRWPDGSWQHDLTERLADALEASVQAPAVDREEMVQVIRQGLAEYRRVVLPEDGLTEERIVARHLFASGVLQDAAVSSMKYQDGSPVEVILSVNPYRLEQTDG